ncbi:hypothetical protein SAMN05421823_11647 [Catalinimonas alkaloidigena]|uniref:Uncharacterized protein n=1 Tax=Catalinimonas alkaloidigena TaxID=1075417 RepID=A0A1G9UF63_9BACT|nr:hypothetical protein [Catalinimonas alkaloidigena]SDM58591.1 hypothetical protein SAMN05421823_11647 [Catalinimonas alkaloidigena]
MMRRVKSVRWNFRGARLRGILLDLVVVFVGVYAAFYLSNLKEERTAEQVRRNYYQSFVYELQDISAQAKRLQVVIDTTVQSYETRMARGERPRLDFFYRIDFTQNYFIVRSAFNEEHFTTVGSAYLRNISSGSNLIALIDKRVEAYQADCRRLLRFEAYDPDRFYAADGSLKPEYQWYLTDLKMIRHYLSALVAAIDEGAIPETEALMDR